MDDLLIPLFFFLILYVLLDFFLSFASFLILSLHIFYYHLFFSLEELSHMNLSLLLLLLKNHLLLICCLLIFEALHFLLCLYTIFFNFFYIFIFYFITLSYLCRFLLLIFFCIYFYKCKELVYIYFFFNRNFNFYYRAF